MAKAGLLFVGTDDGIVLFSNPGAVGRWLRVGQELRGQAVRAVWPAADNPLVVLAAVAGGALQRSDDGGQSWRAVFDGDVSSIVGHHSDAQTIYLGTTDGQVFRSADAGASWEPCAEEMRPAEGGPVRLVVAEDPRRLYLGGEGGVRASADSGASWWPYGVEAPRAIAALAAAPARPGLVYAVAGAALYRCADAGAAWERVAAAQPADSAALAILAGKDMVLLLASGAGLERSADEGGSWTPVGADVAWNGGVTAITPARYHMDTAFAGSSGGQVALSSDRGRSWQMLKQDLPPIRSIAAARLA